MLRKVLRSRKILCGGLSYSKIIENGASHSRYFSDEELTGEVQLAVELDPEAEGAEGLLMRADEKVEILYRKEKELKAPVKEGTTVGEICYLVDGEIWRRERLYAAWTVEAVDLSWCGRQILKRFLVAFP